MVNHRVLIAFFLFYFCLSFPVLSQENEVQIKKSTEKVLIEGKVYFIHVVKKGETVYSICKTYYISPKVLSRENPAVIVGLQPGQVLKIPESLEDQVFIPDMDSFILHKVEAGETFYSISRQYNVSVKEIEEMNPGLDLNDIPAETVIKIPRIDFRPEKQDFPVSDKKYLFYRVEYKDTYYSLSKKFDVSIRKLKRANADKKDGLQLGDVIRIPRTPKTELLLAEKPDTITVVHVEMKDTVCELKPTIYFNKSVKVAMLLPLYLDENVEREVVDSSRKDQYGNIIRKVIVRDENWIYSKSMRFIEFYEGALMALEDIKNRGMSIDLYVFDTDQDPRKVENIARSRVLEEMDLIIGPVYSMNLSIISDYLSNKNIPIVSPFLQKDDLLWSNASLFEANPSNSIEDAVLAGIVATDYNKNIVLVQAGDSIEREKVYKFKKALIDSLRQYGPLEDVNLKEVYYSENRARRDTINEVKDALLKNEENTIVIVSERETFVSEVLAKIFSLSNEYELKLYGFPEWQQFRNIQLEYFHNMDVFILSPYCFDYNRKNVLDVLKRYRNKFHTEPPANSFAWIGYDIMYFFLSGIGTYGDEFMDCYPAHKSEYLITDLRFKKFGFGSGAINQNLFLLKYTKDFREVKVDFPARPEIDYYYFFFDEY